MAYALKYYWEKTVDNKVYRLEIHKKGSTSAAMEIGDVVQGLSLNIDGGEDNLDSPLLTSSLVMTFADAYDHPDSLIKKCGNWAEFYTPDATMWKVLLNVREAGRTTSLWGGYVTPDSYEEDLTYGGSVTITARDNIGHLNDFPFDAEGDTITLRELVESAWAKIESPMRLTWANEWLQCEGIDAPDTHMNVAAFAEDSWHKAVEKALYGYGAVLRYKGENEVVVCPLKSIPTVMASSSNEKEPTFVAGATRMLTPAVKRVEEAAQYDITEVVAEPIKDSDFTGDTYKFTVEGDSATPKAIAWNVSKTESGDGWCAPDKSIFFYPKAYRLYKEEYAQDMNYMFLCCNPYKGASTSKSHQYAEYSRYINASDVTFEMKLGAPYALVDFDYLIAISAYQTYRTCEVAVKVVQNGITSYLQNDNSWGVDEVTRTYDISGGTLSVPVSLADFTGSVLLCFHISNINTSGVDYKVANYAPVYSAGLSINNGSVLARNNVNTIFSEQNNVIISRSPEIAPTYNIVALPEIIKNGIFRKVGDVYQPAKEWAWQGFTPQQLAVYNHLQLLCYYAKPNNILEGTIVNGDLSQYGNIWKWEGKEHVLVAGRYNILTGYIDGAILREFARYEDMWGDIEGVGFPDVEAKSSSSAEMGASASSTPQTYTNTTTVNIGTGGGGSGASYLNDLQDVDVEGVVAGSVLWFDGSNWVDRSLSGILSPYAKADDVNAALAKILDWFTLEDGVLLTKYNLASEKEVSAKGINKGNGGGGSSYNRLDSWDDYDSSKAGYVLSAGLGYDLKVAVDELNGYNLNSRLTTVESNYLGKNGGSVSGNLDMGNNSITSNDNAVLTSYSGVDTYLRASNYLYLSSPNVAVLNGGVYPILHSGNYSNYALPLSGGILESGATGVLHIKSSSARSALYFLNGSSQGGYFGVDGSGSFFLTDTDWNLYWNVIHSGNIGSQSVAYASGAGMLSIGQLTNISAQDHTLWYDWGNQLGDGFAYYYYGILLKSADSNVYTRIASANSRADLRVRHYYYGNDSGWKTIAFTDSNVASATKLATPRTIWGQSFDGTGNVDGKIYQDGKWILGCHSDGNLYIGLDTYGTNDTLIYGRNLYFGTSAGHSMLINSSGNVTIGDVDTAATISGCKLFVGGDTYIGGKFTLKGKVGVSSDYVITNQEANGLHLYVAGNTGTFFAGNGNVLIGTTSDNGAKLQVNGTISTSHIKSTSGLDITAHNEGVGSRLFLTSGVFRPWGADAGQIDFGSSDVRWREIYANGLNISNGAVISSLTVSGNTELQGDLRLRPSGKDFGSSLKFGDGSFCCIQEDTDDHMKITARHGVTFESSEGTITIPKLSVGINGMTVNSPATFNDFIYSSSITPKTDNYYVLGNNNYKWYGVTAYNVNVHEAITIEAGKELRFKDDNGVVHTLKYDSDQEAFIFDGNVNASGEMSARKLNA